MATKYRNIPVDIIFGDRSRVGFGRAWPEVPSARQSTIGDLVAGRIGIDRAAYLPSGKDHQRGSLETPT